MLLEPTSDLPLRTVNVTCWEWAGTARDEGDAAALWLSEYLGKPVRLVRYMGAFLPYPTRQTHVFCTKLAPGVPAVCESAKG